VVCWWVGFFLPVGLGLLGLVGCPDYVFWTLFLFLSVVGACARVIGVVVVLKVVCMSRRIESISRKANRLELAINFQS
jgi:hypothetical protein